MLKCFSNKYNLLVPDDLQNVMYLKLQKEQLSTRKQYLIIIINQQYIYYLYRNEIWRQSNEKFNVALCHKTNVI